MARPRGHSQARGPRRKKSWGLGPGGPAETTLSATGNAIIGLGSETIRDDLTLLRLRGQLQLQLLAADQAAGGFTGAFGIGIVTEPAFAVGITAVPTPITEQEWDGWLYWTAIQMHSITATIADGSNAAAVARKVEVDTKAMRKMRKGDTIFAIVQLASEDGSASLNIRFDSRVLVALP